MVCDGKEEMLFEEVSRLNARRTMSKLGRSLQPLRYRSYTTTMEDTWSTDLPNLLCYGYELQHG